MNKFFVATASFTLLTYMPSGAQAQSSILPDVIGATIGNMSAGWPEKCLSLKQKEKPKAVARFSAEAEPALRVYLAAAGSGADLSPTYKRTWSNRWALDGVVTQDLRAVRDPWASRVERLEAVGLVLGRSEIFGHGIWRAFGADGALLGTYEAEMIRKTKGYAVGRLKLWSPGQEGQARPLTAYCVEPGDHERWAQAKKDAEA